MFKQVRNVDIRKAAHVIGIPRRADVEVVWPCTTIKKSSADDIRKEEKSRQNKAERGAFKMSPQRSSLSSAAALFFLPLFSIVKLGFGL